MIFKSYFINNKCLDAKETNSILISSIIDAVYPEGLGAFKDETSKKRNIRTSIINVLEAMKNTQGFFVDYEITTGKNGESISLSRK